ncbi:MAG: hypothetical protein ABI120_12630 [Gemmatimonadaceae bacterium]
MLVEDGQVVNKNDEVCTWDPYSNPIFYDVEDTIRFVDLVEDESLAEGRDELTGLRQRAIIENGQQISAGTILAKVSRDAYRTRDITWGLPRVVESFEYLLNEVQEVYRLLGVKINDKHIGATVKQMFPVPPFFCTVG